MVYQPSRSVKLKDVVLNHLVKETRYTAHLMEQGPLIKQIDSDRATLRRYAIRLLKLILVNHFSALFKVFTPTHIAR